MPTRCLSWHKYGGRQGIAQQALRLDRRERGVVPVRSDARRRPLGWFKKPITKPDDFKGMKYRTVGISIDLFTGNGRSGERAARRRDRPGDRPRAARRRGVQQRRPSDRILGFPERVQGVHAAELPPERRAVRDHLQQDQVRRAAGQDAGGSSQNAVEAASADMSWKAINRYSQDYIELQTKDR